MNLKTLIQLNFALSIVLTLSYNGMSAMNYISKYRKFNDQEMETINYNKYSYLTDSGKILRETRDKVYKPADFFMNTNNIFKKITWGIGGLTAICLLGGQSSKIKAINLAAKYTGIATIGSLLLTVLAERLRKNAVKTIETNQDLKTAIKNHTDNFNKILQEADPNDFTKKNECLTTNDLQHIVNRHTLLEQYLLSEEIRTKLMENKKDYTVNCIPAMRNLMNYSTGKDLNKRELVPTYEYKPDQENFIRHCITQCYYATSNSGSLTFK